jgi:hypothetical protein
MEKLSRRKLIAQVSVGAGVAGILAACDSSGNTQTTTASASAGNTPVATTSVDKMPAEPLAVLVTDPVRGTIVVIHRDSETTFNNPSLVQAILALS